VAARRDRRPKIGTCRAIGEAGSHDSTELRDRYESEGWWTSDTIGGLPGISLTMHSEVAFNVHSAERPYTGTFGDVELIARRPGLECG
jgi:acyl-CoA synthetase